MNEEYYPSHNDTVVHACTLQCIHIAHVKRHVQCTQTLIHKRMKGNNTTTNLLPKNISERFYRKNKPKHIHKHWSVEQENEGAWCLKSAHTTVNIKTFSRWLFQYCCTVIFLPYIRLNYLQYINYYMYWNIF